MLGPAVCSGGLSEWGLFSDTQSTFFPSYSFWPIWETDHYNIWVYKQNQLGETGYGLYRWFCYGHYRMVSQKVVENCRQRKLSNKVVLNPQKVFRYNISPNPLWLVVAQMDLRHEDSHFWIGIFVAHLGRQILSQSFVSKYCLQVLSPRIGLQVLWLSIVSKYCLQVLSPSIVYRYCLQVLSIGIVSRFFLRFLSTTIVPWTGD